MWSIIATWDFAQTPVSTVAQLLGDGASALDAVVKCGSMVEDDESVDTVGYGGLPNARGELELDAAIMDGRSLIHIWRIALHWPRRPGSYTQTPDCNPRPNMR